MTCGIENFNNYFMLVEFALRGSILLKQIENLTLDSVVFSLEFNWKLI